MKKRYKRVILLAALVLVLGGCSKPVDADDMTQQELDTTQQESSTATETEIVTEVETETEVLPVVNQVTITAVGDCTLGAMHQHGYAGSFHQYYDSYGETYFFENFKEVFENDDMTLINLECVLTDSTNRVDKEFSLKGKPEYTGIMTSSSVEVCSLGNNHTRDYGEKSLTDTIEALDTAGIAYAYNDIVSYYTTEDGIVVAVISARVTSSTMAHEKYLHDGVAEAKEKEADIIIAACHWGVEGDHYPTGFQRELAHELIDEGADLIIGHHPHVLQGLEVYNGKVICYSLGNFSFGGNRNPSDKNTAAYQQTFTLVDGELQPTLEAKIIPSRLSGHNDKNDFQPMIAQGDQAASIIEKMNQYSSKYSNLRLDEEGVLVFTEE